VSLCLPRRSSTGYIYLSYGPVSHSYLERPRSREHTCSLSARPSREKCFTSSTCVRRVHVIPRLPFPYELLDYSSFTARLTLETFTLSVKRSRTNPSSSVMKGRDQSPWKRLPQTPQQMRTTSDNFDGSLPVRCRKLLIDRRVNIILRLSKG
jgi:hypothetical protein